MRNVNGADIMIGAQVITWGDRVRAAFPEILAFLRDEGYQGVEVGMRHFDPQRTCDYIDLFQNASMNLLAVHSGGAFWNPQQAAAEMANIASAVQFAADLGARYVAISGNANETLETIPATADAYNRIGRLCRDEGLELCYHNHNWEFENELALINALMEHTDPELVKLVPDIAWMHRAGCEPTAFINAHWKRIAYLHLKDTDAATFCELGRGCVPVREVVSLLETLPVEWVVVEQDVTNSTPEQSLAISLAYLHELGV